MPLELVASRADTLTVETGCALGYHAEKETPIHLLVRHAPELDRYLLAESVTHDRGEAIACMTDAYGNIVLRTLLLPGMNTIHSSARLRLPRMTAARIVDGDGQADAYDMLRYTLPSRYCESDKLAAFALPRFGRSGDTKRVVENICEWTHHNIEYRHGSGDATLSALEAIGRGYGVCRDFAHVMTALCRALDIPARYVAGHIPLVGDASPGSDIGIDFHAYVEVCIDGRWHVFDPRHDRLHDFHIKLAHGLDAVDTAIATFHGPVTSTGFRVWAHAASEADAGTSPTHPPVLPAIAGR